MDGQVVWMRGEGRAGKAIENLPILFLMKCFHLGVALKILHKQLSSVFQPAALAIPFEADVLRKSASTLKHQ